MGNTPIRILRLAALMLLVAPIAACSGADRPDPAATSASTAVVNCGHTLSLSSPPEKVLIGYPTVWETMNALGVADRVSGTLSGDSTALPRGGESVKVVSPLYNVPREVLLASQTDLVVFTTEAQMSGEDGTATFDDLKQAGITPYVMQGNCLEPSANDDIATVYSDIRALGQLFGVTERADQLAEESQRRVEAVAARRGDKPAPRVAFLQVYDGKLYALGGSNYAAVLGALGAVNEFDDLGTAFSEVSTEAALKIKADHLVVVYDASTTPEKGAAEIKRLLPSAAPVTRGAVSTANTDDFQVGGTSLVDVTEEIGKAIYP